LAARVHGLTVTESPVVADLLAGCRVDEIAEHVAGRRETEGEVGQGGIARREPVECLPSELRAPDGQVGGARRPAQGRRELLAAPAAAAIENAGQTAAQGRERSIAGFGRRGCSRR
jgi:hypothetical protein